MMHTEAEVRAELDAVQARIDALADNDPDELIPLYAAQRLALMWVLKDRSFGSRGGHLGEYWGKSKHSAHWALGV